jgi:2-iminoacetate synthase
MDDDLRSTRRGGATFTEALERLPFDTLLDLANDASANRVDAALRRSPLDRTMEDVAAFLSPAAAASLERLASASKDLTLARFGRTMRLYAPLYLSNECLSTCTYCGFAKELPVARKTLSEDEALAEVRALKRAGFRSILLLTGEHERLTGVDFLVERVRALAREVPQISIEVQVWSEEEYARLIEAGCEGVVIYQETYDRDVYANVHLGGRKRRFDWRLEGPERAARAGSRRLGIGALFGLAEDWRREAICVVAHARFLQKRHWRSQVSVSVPRMRPSAAGYQPRSLLDDRQLAQVICAYRLGLPDAGIVLSTREAPDLRDALARIGISHMSAGSHTEPGGYEHPDGAARQFEISDTRSPGEVVEGLRGLGLDPVWEDWATMTPRVDAVLSGASAELRASS